MLLKQTFLSFRSTGAVLFCIENSLGALPFKETLNLHFHIPYFHIPFFLNKAMTLVLLAQQEHFYTLDLSALQKTPS